MQTVKANNFDKYFHSWSDQDGEHMILKGTSINPLWGMLIIPSCIFFYFIGAGINSFIDPNAWGLLQWPALLGGLFGFLLPVKIMNRKKVKLTFSNDGLGVNKKIYAWKDLGTFSLTDHGGERRTSTSVAFSYGLDRINIPIGWYNKSVAMAALKEINNRVAAHRV